MSRTDAWCIDRETYHADAATTCLSCDYPSRKREDSFTRPAGGQTLVEFALIIPVFLLLMLGVVQMIVVGGAALAVNQAAISCARYASLNPSFAQSSVGSYLSSTASPLISDSGLQPVVLVARHSAARDRHRSDRDSQLQPRDQAVFGYDLFRGYLSKPAFGYPNHDQ